MLGLQSKLLSSALRLLESGIGRCFLDAALVSGTLLTIGNCSEASLSSPALRVIGSCSLGRYVCDEGSDLKINTAIA